MKKINLLTPQIYNRIAAGEVVNNPSAVIKELVENSVDAGANKVVIEVEDGGMKLISVSDNGCGIDEEDIETAFLKHATSKLQCVDDLDAIETFGFRGEALPSIAVVSRVKLTTRTSSSDSATVVELEEGKIISRKQTSGNVGTKIEVRDLFYNTPVRLKYLRSHSRETNEISKFVSRLILTSPYLQITYISNGKTVYKTNGTGLEEAMFVVYGADCIKNCLNVSYSESNVRIIGLIGSPEYTKANSTYQTLSVNGRYVTDKNISVAISVAFQPYLMQHKFPFYVLNVDVPFDEVDVNVHPQKNEVRFVDPYEIAKHFRHALRGALNEYSRAKINDILISTGEYSPDETPTDDDEYYKKLPSFVNADFMNREQAKDVHDIESLTQNVKNIESFDEYATELEQKLKVKDILKSLTAEDNVAQGSPKVVGEVVPTYTKRFEQEQFLEENPSILDRVRILGAAFKTYLILEIDDKVILVDQHAAHERILFDKFMANHSTSMQQCMFPYVFNTSDEEAEFLLNNIENIHNAGVDIEPFGPNCFRITAQSILFDGIEMSKFVEYVLSSMNDYVIDDKKLIVERLAQKACKAAVKAGQMLTEMEIEYIVNSILEGKVLQCPHGRPLTVIVTKTQLEKMFKRIV